MKAGVKLYLSSDDIPGLFGSGKWLLLDAIRREGSLKKAADTLNRGYRKAWGDIRVAEKGLGQILVKKTRGGVNRGTAELTEFGLRLLMAWDRYHAEVTQRARESFDRHIRKLLPDCAAGKE